MKVAQMATLFWCVAGQVERKRNPDLIGEASTTRSRVGCLVGGTLLEDYHLSCSGIVTCGQTVEVDAACDRFT